MDGNAKESSISEQLETIFSVLGTLDEELNAYLSATEQVRHLISDGESEGSQKTPESVASCPMMGHLDAIIKTLRKIVGKVRFSRDSLAL
jgi:hypothetical protein